MEWGSTFPSMIWPQGSPQSLSPEGSVTNQEHPHGDQAFSTLTFGEAMRSKLQQSLGWGEAGMTPRLSALLTT